MVLVEDEHTDFVDAMRTVVEMYPDVIYKPQLNFYFYDDGNPSCLFGYVFYQLGIGLDEIDMALNDKFNYTNDLQPPDPNGARVRFILKAFGYTESFCSAAEVAQIRQDEKKKWSEVLEAFRMELVERGIADMYWR